MRADKFFADKYGSRTKSAEAIERGLILVNGKPIKAKTEIKETDTITFIEAEESFVSNGGYKLDRAIKTFAFDCKDKIFADIGASTGGFTDCLLQNGAKKVYTIDVGESLLHESLIKNERIVQMENTNARYLTKKDFPEEIDGVVTDVSFISLRLRANIPSPQVQRRTLKLNVRNDAMSKPTSGISASNIGNPINAQFANMKENSLIFFSSGTFLYGRAIKKPKIASTA